MTGDNRVNGEMPKAYEPEKVERRWYQFWLDKDYFRAEVDPAKKPFVIIMPLPNVTGGLHLGHVLTDTLQDIMTRRHRMLGDSALWLPGIDHAGIAAQVVVERMLAEEGLDRHQLGREKFLERMFRWAEECRKTITEQHQRLGDSCDWSRELFTLDEGPSRAVRTAFVRLYAKGLIYRGERIINWCPRCATALSDLETDHKDLTGHLYYFRYPLAEGDGYIVVATTRPETYVGDTAVAVNPGDDRYKDLVGKNVILPGVNREIPIIADEAVDPSFGTGAVKMTPAHDPVDFDVAQRKGLPLINILNPDATLNENAGPYAGMERFAARQAVLDDMEKAGLLEKIEPYSHAVGHCLRCQTVIEPLASQQWFVETRSLAEPAMEAVRDGRIKIVPEHFTKTYFNWMENIRDWCISRQLWWGHQIPVWYCDDCAELTVAVDDPTQCAKCGSAKIEQDTDVLDTWFSSALWPHSTLGWPDDTEDMRYFYPTTVMETAYDILFFWVARMIMMGLEDTGDIPFRTVYLHGLIRDEKGEKMSKTRGNVIDPLDAINEYGTDALRFAVVHGTSPGNDSKLSPIKLEAGRNFANKLWNATRFILRSIDTAGEFGEVEWGELKTEDRWILSRLSRTVSSVNGLFVDYQFGEASRQIHDFLWGEFCDWYIELAKVRLRRLPDEALSPLSVLVYVLETSLRLLHPYMPFITEELWQALKSKLPGNWQSAESIMVSPFPEANAKAIDPEAERVVEAVIEIVRTIRDAQAQYKERRDIGGVTIIRNIQPVEAIIYADELLTAIASYSQTIQKLTRAKSVTTLDRRKKSEVPDNALPRVLKESEVIITFHPTESMVDLAAEKQRLQKEIDGLAGEVTRLETRLEDKQFLSKAPEKVVEKERERLAAAKDRQARLEQELGRLG